METAEDAAMPAIESARPKAGRVGGPSAWPVRCANPLIASARVPKPARAAYGPVWPKPVMRATTRPGLSSCRTSGERPQRSRVPGRKFSTSTSAVATRRRKTSAPAADDRLSATVRLLREISDHQIGVPSTDGPWPRIPSPALGCSILITSAPKSPRIWQASGPARIVDASTTRMPLSGPLEVVISRIIYDLGVPGWEYDVVVVGAGPAGLTCAIGAARGGARVLLVEKDRRIGGALHLSGGHLSAGGTSLQRAAGIEDTPELHLADIQRISNGTERTDLVRMVVEEAPAVVEWLV